MINLPYFDWDAFLLALNDNNALMRLDLIGFAIVPIRDRQRELMAGGTGSRAALQQAMIEALVDGAILWDRGGGDAHS